MLPVNERSEHQGGVDASAGDDDVGAETQRFGNRKSAQIGVHRRHARRQGEGCLWVGGQGVGVSVGQMGVTRGWGWR